MTRVSIQDYVPGEEAAVQDPTDPNEMIPKRLSEDIGEVLTLVQELAQMEEAEVDLDRFYDLRGRVLDRLEGGPVWEWLNNLRMYGRCRYPQWEIEDDAEEEAGQRESASDPAA